MIIPASDTDEFYRNLAALSEAGITGTSIGGNEIEVSDDDADAARAAIDAASSDTDGRPNVSARKAEWEAYAGSLGIDTTDMTKDDIVAAVDQQED